MTRGLSITDYYTPFAGLQDEIKSTELDAHHNPKGRGFDLGHESAFGMFGVILYNPRHSEAVQSTGTDPKSLWVETTKALQSKGFNVYEAKSEKDFLDTLPEYDVAYFNSSGRTIEDPERFLKEVKKFHEAGKGLGIFADNDPFYVEANLILEKLWAVKLKDSTKGNKILTVGEGKKSGQFARHLLTTGIVNLHEGNTICYPTKLNDKFQVLATSTDNHPCMMYSEAGVKQGRIVVDCGFTKLYSHNWEKTAGTERYVRNIAVWLLAIDYRMKVGAPIKGDIEVNNSTTSKSSKEME